MRNKVVLNEHGFSIESCAKLYQKGKWYSRYVICRRVRDIGAPVLQVYKPQLGFRGAGTYKYAVVLQHFVGSEKGFELSKHSLTLAVLLKNESIIMSFARPQQLSMWELWIREALGPSSCFFMQVKEAPKGTLTRQHICREVRVHVTENKFAIVAESAPKVIAYFPLSEVQNISCMDSTFFFSKVNANQSREIYALISGQTENFYSILLRSKESNNLRFYLARQNTEGSWLSEGSRVLQKPGNRSSFHHRSSKGLTITIPRKFIAKQLNQPVSELLRISRRLSGSFRNNFTRTKSITVEPSYANIPKIRETLESEEEVTYENDCHIDPNGDSYANVDQSRSKLEHLYENVTNEELTDYVNTYAHQQVHVLSISQSKKSVVSRSSDQPRTPVDDAEKYQNWEKAKLLISSFKKPIYNANNHSEDSSDGYIGDGILEASPVLNQAKTAISVHIEVADETTKVPGLCKPQSEGLLLGKAAPPVRSNLLSSIAGSFSKYDGERATHEYPRQQLSVCPLDMAPNSPLAPSDTGPPDVFENAVMKGRERLMQSDRRNSSFSNCTRISSIPARSSFRIANHNSTKAQEVPSGTSSIELQIGGSSSEAVGGATLPALASSLSPNHLVVEATIEIDKSKEGKHDRAFFGSSCASPPPLPPRSRIDSESTDRPLLAKTISEHSLMDVNYCDLACSAEERVGSALSGNSEFDRAQSGYTEVDQLSTLATKQAFQKCRRDTNTSLRSTRNKSNSLNTIIAPQTPTEQFQGSSSPSTVSVFLQKCRKPWKKYSNTSISHSNLLFD
ncbi:hypothetical protein L596_003883 [Steinernema carpocapsae]|uniref:PH domain-containing protein n=1 Tax=Steinernema carpocapsae TaxID=34508 RepID=A0A4U8UTY8_STECR|nr:hypothetical protein L596_003883 [Steinernema carpocapsae]